MANKRDGELERVREEKERWAKKYKLTESSKVTNDWGMEVKAVYTPDDVVETDYLRDLGLPGEYPFTRGPYPEMSRHKPWRFAILSGFGTAEDTNARWKFLLKGGQRSFTWVPDLPTQAGLDSDDPRCEGEVGRVGMAVDTMKDLEILYADLPIEEIPWSPNLEGAAPQMLAMHIAACEKIGVDRRKLTGTVANDPLDHSIGKGYYLLPMRPAVRLATDCTEFCIRNMPRFYPTNLKGGLMWEQGATPDQEIGYCFAIALTYIDELLKRGLNIDEIAPKFTFFIGCGHQIFEEVAKVRAARRLWARLMKEKYGAKVSNSMLFRFTNFVCGSFYQVEWPELNLVRGAYACLAGALAGAQGMLLAAWDEPFAIPTERSHALALGTQQICAEEIGINKTVDPLGGSYYVEALTNYVEREAVKRMKEMEDYGGCIKAIEEGFLQRQLLTNYYRKQRAIDTGEKVIVRKNKYVLEEGEREVELHKHNPEVERRQVERLRQVRATRNKAKVKESLDNLRRAARGEENLMPHLIEAAKSYVSIGEMTRTLKEVFGEWKEPIVA